MDDTFARHYNSDPHHNKLNYKLSFNDKQFTVESYNPAYMVYDLEGVLFTQNSYTPWIDGKYEKRINSSVSIFKKAKFKGFRICKKVYWWAIFRINFQKFNSFKAFNYFISAEGGEFTPEQTCGIIGNLLVESGTAGDINPLAKNDAEGSFGIAQWNPARAAGNRFDKLKDFSRERGYNHTDLFAQLEFIKYELHKEKYLGLSQLRNAKTPEEASRVFEKYYERPAKGSTDNRIAFAEEVFEKMEA